MINKGLGEGALSACTQEDSVLNVQYTLGTFEGKQLPAQWLLLNP